MKIDQNASNRLSWKVKKIWYYSSACQEVICDKKIGGALCAPPMWGRVKADKNIGPQDVRFRQISLYHIRNNAHLFQPSTPSEKVIPLIIRYIVCLSHDIHTQHEGINQLVLLKQTPRIERNRSCNDPKRKLLFPLMLRIIKQKLLSWICDEINTVTSIFRSA